MEALRRVIGLLPSQLPASVFIVLHVWPDTPSSLVSTLSRAAAMRVQEAKNEEPIRRIGKRTMFTCPECNGALWEIEAGGQPEYRCHVGHGYSPRILAAEQNLVFEQSLWSAIRALKESAAMDERLANRSAELGLERAEQAHRANATDKHTQVASLMQLFQRLKSTSLPALS